MIERDQLIIIIINTTVTIITRWLAPFAGRDARIHSGHI
jgi:hypothetical protein